jgi:hypothetical protein
MPHDSDLYRELQKLRSRQGVDRPDLSRHLGPEIRRRCRLTGIEREAQVRAAAETMLGTLIDTLPVHLKEAALWAFALPREYRFPRLDDRAGRLAVAQRISQRTARRRMDEALFVMAVAGEETAEPPAGEPAGSGWRVSSLRGLFRLDTTAPELYEIRTIVATQEIDETTVRIGVPDAPDGVPGLTVDALFGARIRSTERRGGNINKVVLALPRTLVPGEKHEFWLRVVLPPGQPTWSHYAIVPLDPCESGTVRVRFAADRRPGKVWQLDEVPYTDLRATAPADRDVIEPTAQGDVSRDFYGLRQGYGYGIAWTPLS